MTKREPTAAQQDEAYEHGHQDFRTDGVYDNPYDSDEHWLLYLAYEQGWNDGRDWELSRGAVSAHPED
jgi:hypothetical protein